MDKDELKYWLGFSLIPGIGPAKFSLLENHFGDLGRAWRTTATELKAAGLDGKSVDTIIATRPKISLNDELEKLERYKVNVVTWREASYPSRLKEIADRPPLLYFRGTLLPKDEWAIAVVGPRHSSVYGRQVTEEIASDLARNKITIVSGLARGIDAVAHRTALEAGGRTIAVFGCGVDMVYPSEHMNLARQIMEHGAVVSEFPLGTRPRAEHFPQRNRIMSGMSLGVLVVEAGERSGALLTANYAVEQNREVFAIPGSIFSPLSIGANRLIQEGAKLVHHCADILEELNLTMSAQQQVLKEPIPTTDIESQLLSCLSKEVSHIDEICHRSGLPIATVSSTLTVLEFKGLAKQVGAMNYVLI